MYFERKLTRKKLPFEPKRRDRQYEHFLEFKEEHGSEAALAAQNDARRGGRPLGLVTVPNSTKTAEPPNRARGLTRLGARTLRQGAYLLEEWHGKDCITFATATVPSVTDEELEYICTNWHEIVHRFVKRIRFELEKKGLPALVIHVTEIQVKRAQNSGQEVPHIHLAFQGRKRKSTWAINPKKIEKWWKSALKLPYNSERTWRAICQLARVKKSVSRYLSKYLAKKTTKTSSAISPSTSPTRLIRSWWGVTDSLRQFIKAATRVVSDTRTYNLWESHEKEDRKIWEYHGMIAHPWDGGVIVFCRFGRLTPSARQEYLRRNL